MTEEGPSRQRKRKRLWLALTAAGVVLAGLVVPPWIGVNRYKSRITHLIAASVGRPVRLSSVEMRLLPQPAFVLTDLTVEEDPAYGAEPILHANTVRANIRLLSLWRGRLEIGSISVDEASLNLVRTAEGRWNLESLFRVAAKRGQPGAGEAGEREPLKLPYLEATNSRINIKRGGEKLPYSLVNTDLSFWEEGSGEWRVRLRGQPARTDVSLDLADTGVVRVEASLRRAAELRLMPIHLDLEWREAQLGQLARLVIGSDPGWRGDLTGEVHLDGSSESAQVQTRLRATGVHRAEFAPVSPLDFDARCGFIYHFPERAMEKLTCDSPLGDGRVHLAGELPGGGRPPQWSVELDRVPVAAGLDALRTVRSGIGPGLVAKGAASGRIAYSAEDAEGVGAERPAVGAKTGKTHVAGSHTAQEGPLTGSFTVEGFELDGEGLKTPIRVAKIVLEPVEMGARIAGSEPDRSSPAEVWRALTAAVAVPAGAAGGLTVNAQLSLSGYAVAVRGQAAIARVKELAKAAGVGGGLLDDLGGESMTVDLNAEGPWLSAERVPLSSPAAGSALETAIPASNGDEVADDVSGTVTLHNANWKAEYLANHVEIAEATLHFDNTQARWDPVVFTYGPVKGTASMEVPLRCEGQEPCRARFGLEFGNLDAGSLQAAILGAHEKGTLLTELIARFSPSTAVAWPELEGTVSADSLVLGPVTLEDASATLRVNRDGAEITGLDASVLGGQVHGAGTVKAAGAGQEKPSYTLTGQFEKLNPAAVGQLLGLRFAGGAFDADGKVELSGFTAEDLAASANGALRFDWRQGSAGGPEIPAALGRFDRWSGAAEIADGKVALKANEIAQGQGARRRAVEATVTLGDPATVTFGGGKAALAKR